jgi:hypothetical protein
MNSILKSCLFTAAAIGAGVLPSFAGVTAKVPFDLLRASLSFRQVSTRLRRINLVCWSSQAGRTGPSTSSPAW